MSELELEFVDLNDILYHKIQGIYLRDSSQKGNPFTMGAYTLPEFEYLAEMPWVWTEKVDGMNIRIMWNGDTVQFGGRTKNTNFPGNILRHLMETFSVEMFKDLYPQDAFTLVGEGYGRGIQKGSNYPTEQTFIGFDIVTPFNNYLLRKDVVDIFTKLGVPVVPIVGQGTLPEAIQFVVNGFKSYLKDDWAEGIVAKPSAELKTRLGHRLITKIKRKDFLHLIGR